MIEPRRWIGTCIVALAATAGLLWLPAPRHVACTAVLRPRASRPVFVTAAGQVTAVHVRPGATVFAGEPLARLQNVDLEIQDARLAVQEAKFAARLKSLEYGQHADPDVARQLASTAAFIESVRSERRELARELARLVLVAPTAGVFLPPPERHSDVPESTLPAWTGQPLAERNQGARLEAGVLVGEIGNPRRCDAILFVDPESASDVAIGQSVSLHLPGMAAGAFRGRIVEISVEQFGAAATESESAPSVRPSPLLALASATPAAHPAAHYVARVELDEEVQHVPVGAHGDALVQVDASTLGTRMWRWLSRTFRFL